MKYAFFINICIIVLQSVLYASTSVERYAIIAGVNNGGENRQILKYSVQDAVVFSKVMFDMGGLSEHNTIFLKDPSVATFDSALHAINRLLSKSSSDSRKEVIIYYSGHADESGLLFGNQCFDYRILRTAIDSIRSDVKITILDACASGSITRIKGGVRKNAFLVDASSDLTGYAFITSSSEQEVSQESDKIQGSFFTHFLVSGLRGAADMSNDGKITLSEAYQFAFHETLAGTEATSNGPQHPSYDMRLTGSGDVVMTDIRSMNAIIKFPKEMSGRIFIRNTNNQLIAEMMKQKGKIIEIGVPSGVMTIQLSTSDGAHEGNFNIQNDSTIIIELHSLKPVPQPKVPVNKKGTNLSTVRYHHAIARFTSRDSLVLKGIAISLLGNIAFDSVMGIQYALFSNESNKPFTGLQRACLGKNYCKKSFAGVQKALLSNSIESDLKGSQQALLYNYTTGNSKGTQFSVGVNHCKDTFSGIQFGLVSVTEKDFYGIAIDPITSICKGKVKGLQIGCLNYSKTLSGVQISPKLNISGSGGMMGVQLACYGNISTGNVYGVQCAALYNQSKNMNGMQVALINYADTVKGLQIGLINITDDMYGYPVGLFNYSKKGVFTFNVWYDEQSLIHFTLQSGTRNFFNSFTAAVNGNGTRATGFGMGFRIPLKYASIESDIHHFFTFKHLNEDLKSYDITEKARLTITTRFIPMVSISAGPSYNLLFNFDRKQNAEPVEISKRNLKRLAQGIYSWPGFHFGIAVGRF